MPGGFWPNPCRAPTAATWSDSCSSWAGLREESGPGCSCGTRSLAAEFPYDRAPLFPEQWPSRKLPVNRERIYDFYSKEAEYFR